MCLEIPRNSEPGKGTADSSSFPRLLSSLLGKMGNDRDCVFDIVREEEGGYVVGGVLVMSGW